MSGFSAEVAALKAGVDRAEIERLGAMGMLDGNDERGYTEADVRRVAVIGELARAGLSIDDLGVLVRGGALPLDFLDTAGTNVLTPLSDTTFAQLAERTGIAVERLLILREVTGGTTAQPDDQVREQELEIVPLIELQVAFGFRWPAIERGLRATGNSLRRVAEAEAEWWRSEVQGRMLAEGATAAEVADRAAELSPRLSAAADRALMSIYHAQQRHVWLVNIVDGIATGLEQAGLHRRTEVDPAMGFLDLTGYTALTEERGDVAAAGLAERLNRIVQRISVRHGGRPVKWLGDGVMFHFPDPRGGVLAAMEMAAAVTEAGLPPAHVGLHSGPVVTQEGDFYGRTVNVAARIGEFARPGEVLVSREVVAVADGLPVAFRSIGPVALDGVSGLLELFAAEATPESA